MKYVALAVGIAIASLGVSVEVVGVMNNDPTGLLISAVIIAVSGGAFIGIAISGGTES